MKVVLRSVHIQLSLKVEEYIGKVSTDTNGQLESILPYEPWDQRNYLWIEGNFYINLPKFKKRPEKNE